MITRKSLADEIDLLDADIKVLNESKKDCFDAYRDQMIGAGIAKPNIKAEIDAVKAAIKRRREAVKDEHALIEKEDLIDEVFHEITRAPRTRVENKEEFDAETGELSPKLAHTIVTGMQTEAGRAALVAAVDIMIEREEAQERNTPETAKESPRKAAEAVTERTAFNPVANVGEGFADESAALSVDPASRTDDERERQHASTVGFADDCRTGGKEQEAAATVPVGEADARSLPANFEPDGGAISEVKGRARLENAAGVEPPPSVPARKTAADYRPHCVRPSNCASGSIHQHCHSCKTAMHEHEREKA